MRRLLEPDPGPDDRPHRNGAAAEHGLYRWVVTLAVLGFVLAVGELLLSLDPDTGLFGLVLVAAIVVTGLRGRAPGFVVFLVAGIVFVTAAALRRDVAVDGVFWGRTGVRFAAGLLAVWVVASLRDARLRAERFRRQLERDERLRAAITSVITHDLRSPLTAIRLHAQVAKRSLDGEAAADRVPRALDAIAAATNQLEALVTDLSDVVRIQSRELQVRPHPLDPAALARDVVAVQQPLAEQKGVRLTLEAAPDVPLVRGDRLERAVTNLVGNAVKFTPPGGSVRVRIARAGGDVQIAVDDTGPGIAPEHLPFIFDRGVRAPKQAGGGSGLGLFITRGIVEANGGRVSVRSKLSEGSTFTIWLPALTGPLEQEETPEPPAPAP